MEGTRRRWLVNGAVAAGLTAAALTIGAAHEMIGAARGAIAPAEASAALATSADPCTVGTAPDALSQAFRCATSRVLPSVVHVKVESRRAVRAPAEIFRGSPFGDLFPEAPGGPSREQWVRGSGSGFVFHEGGYILTNNHVVDGADRVRVVTQDGRELDARVVGRDPNTDIAVVKVDVTDLPIAELGDSDPIQVGDWVVALGYPLQLGVTVTSGIISATSRSIGILRSEETPESLENFLQTDAAINPGNSGGPLVDLQGRVVGVNSAIASATGFYSGYGFAVPVNLARRIASDLIEYGVVHRPRLGVRIRDATSADAEAFGLARASGAVVAMVEHGTPAAEAGIQLGDVIRSVEGEPVASVSELQDRVARQRPGDRVRVGLVRYGKQLDVQVRLGEFDAPLRASPPSSEPRKEDVGRLGLRAERLTPELARRLQVEGAQPGGVVITGVQANSEAARAGLAPGMVIERLNGVEVENPADLDRLVAKLPDGRVVSLIVRLPTGERTILNFRPRID